MVRILVWAHVVHMTPRLSQGTIDGQFADAAPLLEYNGPFTLQRVVLQTARTPVDRLFRAFSDRTRLRILHLLQQGELCVCDLVSILRVPQPTASRHLAYLRRAGLVRVRQEQSWKYYSLAEPRNTFHAKLLECLQSCFTDVPELGRDAARRHRVKVGKCCD